jgi:hypothetical protein
MKDSTKDAIIGIIVISSLGIAVATMLYLGATSGIDIAVPSTHP